MGQPSKHLIELVALDGFFAHIMKGELFSLLVYFVKEGLKFMKWIN